MNRKQQVVLLGAGAIGVLPGAKLAAAEGVELTVVASGERLSRYREKGIFLNGKRIDFAFASPQELPEADLVIVATKTPALRAALEEISPAVSEKSVFLPLLNGISASDVIRERFPLATVLKGFYLGHASVRQGNQISHDGIGTIYCGGDDRAKLDFTVELLRSAGIDVEIPENIDVAMWQKFVLNVGVNQTQGVFNADYGQVQQSPAMLRFAWDLMEEAVAAGRASGVALGDEVIESAMMVICKMPGNVKTSMLQDVEAHRETEVDAFAGTVCRLAEKYGLDVPKNQSVLKKIKGL